MRLDRRRGVESKKKGKKGIRNISTNCRKVRDAVHTIFARNQTNEAHRDLGWNWNAKKSRRIALMRWMGIRKLDKHSHWPSLLDSQFGNFVCQMINNSRMDSFVRNAIYCQMSMMHFLDTQYCAVRCTHSKQYTSVLVWNGHAARVNAFGILFGSCRNSAKYSASTAVRETFRAYIARTDCFQSKSFISNF